MLAVAFVRAVMIGREGLHRAVLLDLFSAAGARNPASYISTGNVSFEAPSQRIGPIVAAVERGIADVVGRPTPLYVRTLDELQATVADDPFATAPFGSAADGEVLFFRDRVPPVELPITTPRGDFVVFGRRERELFAVTRHVPGAHAPGGLVERVTGERVTARAWSTVTRIVGRLTP